MTDLQKTITETLTGKSTDAPPGWVTSLVDAEVAVVVGIEFTWLWQETQKVVHFEDSRYVSNLCIDIVKHFCQLHWSEDPDYWHNDLAFLDEVDSLVSAVHKQLRKYPGWLNNEYRWAYGKETLQDLLAKP
jgi:hypothetical protein